MNPVTPSSMISGRPPTFDATTGTSHAIASSAASPKLSCAGRQQEQIRDRQPRDQVLLFADEHDLAGQAVLGHPAFDVGAHRAVADEQEPRTHAPPDQAKHLERHVDALHRPEVRDVNDERVAAIRRAQPGTQCGVGPPPILGAIEKIRDDADRAANAERGDRCPPSGSGTPP